jgi:DNA-directed RNA polymerase specialized sigma24 family protein
MSYTDARVSSTRPAMSYTDARVYFTRPAMSVTDARVCFTRRPMSFVGAPLGVTRGPTSFVPAALRLACAPLFFTPPCAPLVAMSEGKKDPPVPSSGSSLHDEDAPVSDEDAPFSDNDAPTSDEDAPLPPDDTADNDGDATTKVTRELTNAFLVKKATQERILQVVRSRVPHGTPAEDVEDLVQQTNARAVETTSLAKSVQGMRPWISRIAQNLVIDHFRKMGRELAWIDRSVDVQELPPDDASEGDGAERPPEDPTAPPRPVEMVDERKLDPWLGENVKTAADRLTLEMLRFKAVTGKTNAVVAAEFGMSEAAYDKRVQRFKGKWIPAWKKAQAKERRDRVLVWLLLVAVALVILWALLHEERTEDIRPTSVPVLLPVPSASASGAPVEERRFNQAAPTDGGDRKPGTP